MGVESDGAPGQGSTFYVRLPLEPREPLRSFTRTGEFPAAQRAAEPALQKP